MLAHIRPALVMIVLFTILTGLIYPLAITGIAKVALPYQAGGSLLHRPDGSIEGSILIAQAFAKPEYLHPRPSAAGNGYDASNSGGSNLGPLDQKLIGRVKGDAAILAKDYGSATIPADAVTTSASGLDPDISPLNARLQAARIAARRGASVAQIQVVIDGATHGALFGFIGQPAVNVLAVNRALDARYPVVQAKG